jgi:hypothetical protein
MVMIFSQTTYDPPRALMDAALDTAWMAVYVARAPSVANRASMASAITAAGAAGERDFVRLQQKAIDAFCAPPEIAIAAPNSIKAVERPRHLLLVAGTDHEALLACERVH